MIYKTLNHGSAAHIFFPLSRSQERRQPESIRSIEQLAELVRRNKTINGRKEEGAENKGRRDREHKPFICGQSINTREPRPPRLYKSYLLCWLCVYVLSMYRWAFPFRYIESACLDILMSSPLDLKLDWSQKVSKPLKRCPQDGKTTSTQMDSADLCWFT